MITSPTCSADLPPQLVEVSLYGASEAVYESVTGIPGSYRRCLAGVDALLRRGVTVGLKTVILTENVHEVQAMRSMADERGVAFRVDPAVFPCRDGDQAPIDHRIDPQQAVALEMADQQTPGSQRPSLRIACATLHPTRASSPAWPGSQGSTWTRGACSTRA